MPYGGSWDHSKVHDYSRLHNTATEKGGEALFETDTLEDIEGTWQYNITQGLAIRMKSIGIGKIKDDNIEMVYLRCLQVDKVLGPILTKYNDERDKEGRRFSNYTITLDDIERRVGLWASTDNDRPLSDTGFGKRLADELAHNAKRNSAIQRGDWRARGLIRALKAGDDWTDQHSAAARRIGLDPDNYRLVDTDKVTFDNGQSILDHADNAKNAMA